MSVVQSTFRTRFDFNDDKDDNVTVTNALDVSTGLGDMQVFLTKLGKRVTLSTGQGTVQCHVPGESEFEVDARAEIGRIGNDFGFEVRKVGDYSAAMTGVRGGGEAEVILRTASGHISLIRRSTD